MFGELSAARPRSLLVGVRAINQGFRVKGGRTHCVEAIPTPP